MFPINITNQSIFLLLDSLYFKFWLWSAEKINSIFHYLEDTLEHRISIKFVFCIHVSILSCLKKKFRTQFLFFLSPRLILISRALINYAKSWTPTYKNVRVNNDSSVFEMFRCPLDGNRWLEILSGMRSITV